MKKSFTFLFIFSLLLTVFSALPAKADQEISFAIPDGGWSWGNQTDDCAGNFNEKHVVNQGAFVWSGGYYSAVERKDDTWTGVGSGSKCCTRNLVPFAASTYTITLVTKRLSDNVTMTLPVITVQQGTPSTHYAATAQWDKDGVLQTEDVSSSHQFYYTDESYKKSRDKEVTLTYNNVEINAAGNYQISIDFPSGNKDKYLMKTLTIISSNPSYNVTVTADGSKGSVSGAGLKEQGSLVELSVSEEEGFAFNGWTSVSGVNLTGHLNDNPLSFIMPGNAVSLTADFTTTTCSKSKVIQCEDYDSGLSKPSEGGDLPSGLEPSADQSGYQGTGYALFRKCTGEMYFLVNLPASTYTFTVICQNGGDKYLKLYNSEGTQVGSGYQLTINEWGGSWQTKTTSSYVLSAGNYYIGLSASGAWAAFDQITITASTNVFCEPACTKHTVTLTAGANGSVSGGGEQCDGSVTVTATPNSDYRFVNWTNTTTSEEVSTDAEYTFDLSADISLTANFELDPCSSSLTIEVEGNYAASGDYSGATYPSNIEFVAKNADGDDYQKSCHGSGYVNFRGSGWEEVLIPVNIPVSGTYKVKAYAGEKKKMHIRIYATTSTEQGYITYKSTTYYRQTEKLINDDNSATFVESDYTDAVALPTGICLVGLQAEWSWSAWDQITITRTDGTAFCPNTITMQKSGDASADDPTSSPANTAMAGTEVTITAGAPSANHYFINWTATPAVTFENATDLSTTFSMPASNVTITANYGEVVSSALTFNAGDGGSITSATAGGNAINSGDAVASGTSVTLTAGANSNHVFINWTDNNNSNAVVSTNAEFTFSMPATATAYTANFAQVDNKIITGSETTVTEESGAATLTVTSVSDFNAFNHNVLKFAYSNMDGKHKGQKVAFDEGYSYASSAGATGFGFYYKTEKADDDVAFCFDTRNGQVKWELQATNNVWKYYYFAHAEAAGWNHGGIIIYMNGDDTGNHDIWNGQATHTTYKNSGAFYMSEIAATTITSKPDIANYHYTNNRGGAMQVNEYGTLCLPMAGTISGATLYSVAGKEESDNTYLVLEEEGNTIVAGKPYITQSTATSYTVTMSGAHSAVQDGNGLVGTYELNPLTPYDETHHNYFLYANAFKKAGTGVTVGAYRAYLNWDAVSDAPAQAPSARRIRMVIEGTEVETGMETVTAMPKTTKVLIDGQLFIIREGKRYTLTGARAQ